MSYDNESYSDKKSIWGTETTKALKNFGPREGTFGTDGFEENGFWHPDRTPRRIIRAYAEVKLAALEAIQETSRSFDDKDMAALRSVASEIIEGRHDNAFPLPMAQGGAGTSLHMNMNEVLSKLAFRLSAKEKALDPIEDLARYQSTNDTFASAVVITAFRLVQEAEAGTVALQEKLVELEARYDNLLMVGRTEMQDALPIRVGSLFGAYAGAVERDRWRLSKVAERVREIPLGGTALGTGFGAPRQYVHAAERHLRNITGLPLSRSQNMMDGVSLKDTLAEVASTLSLTAMNIGKMAADMLYYTSSALREFSHPELQYGSSMMPLKTNPVLLERCRGLTISAMGEADKVKRFAEEGQLQLNAWLPFLLNSLVRCAEECMVAGRDYLCFLDSTTPDAQRMETFLSRSQAVLNALMPLIGYHSLKGIRERIEQENPASLAEVAALVSAETNLSLEEISAALTPSRLTGPPRDAL